MAHSARVALVLRRSRSHAIGGAIVLRRRFPRALQWHVRTPGGHRRLVVIPAGRNTWMMEMPVVDSWSSVVSALRLRWRLRRNIRRWNTGQMGQMRRWRRNLMGSGARRWRRRVTHVGMRRLLRLWLRWMSVNHPAARPSTVSSFRNHFHFGFWDFWLH